MTTMQGGERLVLAGTRALAVTITEVPELSPGTIERRYLCEVQIVPLSQSLNWTENRPSGQIQEAIFERNVHHAAGIKPGWSGQSGEVTSV
jgi:hypothetical protein